MAAALPRGLALCALATNEDRVRGSFYRKEGELRRRARELCVLQFFEAAAVALQLREGPLKILEPPKADERTIYRVV
jgi:hypothetical protein